MLAALGLISGAFNFGILGSVYFLDQTAAMRISMIFLITNFLPQHRLLEKFHSFIRWILAIGIYYYIPLEVFDGYYYICLGVYYVFSLISPVIILVGAFKASDHLAGYIDYEWDWVMIGYTVATVISVILSMALGDEIIYTLISLVLAILAFWYGIEERWVLTNIGFTAGYCAI